MPELNGYKLAYSLPDRCVCLCRYWLPAAAAAFPAREFAGTRGEPHLNLKALPDRIELELEYFFSSGQMERYEPAGAVGTANPRAPEQLTALIGEAQVEQLRALYPAWDQLKTTDRERWLLLILQLFAPKDSGPAYPVAPDRAIFYELGQSISNAPSSPQLTLRLGRQEDELVLDHGWNRERRERQLELVVRLQPGTAEASAEIERRMGAEMAETAAWFHAKGRRFVRYDLER